MSLISIIHPSRSRPEKAYNTARKWIDMSGIDIKQIDYILSLDSDDPFLSQYYCEWDCEIINNNRSSVEAINIGAKAAKSNILMVLSDDTECFEGWAVSLLKEIEGKTDWILKTQDDIQKYIITMPVMDRVYYNRTGYIYHPEFKHLFCDTYMTCVADITGRKLTSDLVFHHDNPGHFGKPIDDVNRKNDATWQQGEEVFLRLMREFSPQDRAKIKDQSMVNWLRMKGIR